MTSRSRPGVNEYFDEYYEELDPLISGEIENVEYQIYKISNTHYCAYAQFPKICTCMIETGVLPVVPVKESINFGPTKDGWIGFTTNGITEYNYNRNWEPLQDDRREEPNKFNYFEKEDICRWTPRLLESALTTWICKVKNEIENIRMQCSHIDKTS
jgi:hypothetical protein